MLFIMLLCYEALREYERVSTDQNVQVSKILMSNRHQVKNGETLVILSIHVDLPLDLVECIVVR